MSENGNNQQQRQRQIYKSHLTDSLLIKQLRNVVAKDISDPSIEGRTITTQPSYIAII